MPSKQPNSNPKLRRGLYRLNNANTDILLSGSLSAFNLVALDHYIKQLRKVGNKSDQSNVAHQSNKPKQSDGSATAPTTFTGFKPTTTCATPSNCIGCAPFSCAKSDSASPYFEPATATAIGRTGEFFGSCGGNTEQFFGSTTQGKNECGRSWDSFITRFNSQTKFGSTQHISNDGVWSINSKRNLNERPNNDGTINSNPFISNPP